MPRIEQPESVESEAAAVASADEPAIEPAPRRPARRPRREPPPEPRRATRVPREAPPVLAGAAVHPLEGDAMFTLTLTERDKDDERRLPLIESISVELCDVDDDNGGEIDLDLFEGDRRIHKIRKLGQGRSRLFRAPSGGWYRLRVMRIRVEPPLVELALFAAS